MDEAKTKKSNNNDDNMEIVRQKKSKEDFSQKASQLIEAQSKNPNFENAVEQLLSLEKQTRQAEDESSTKQLACAIIKLSYERKDWKAVNNNLTLLSKRRGQLRPVIQGIVQLAATYIEELQGPTKMELIDTLLQITQGKIYVEIERARITLILAHIREKEGKISEASDILQDIQVETFGQMDKKEKTQFLLEQMRLTLEKKDLIKTQIISNKVNRRMLDGEGFEEVKLNFYDLLIKYYSFESKYLDIAQAYMKIYATPSIQKDSSKFPPYLQLACIFGVLAPYDNEQSDLVNRINSDENMKHESMAVYQVLLKTFLTKELIRWVPFEKAYQPYFRQHKFFQESATIFWKDLAARVTEHNIRVAAAYYSRIRIQRLAKLLDLAAEDLETKISDLIVNGTIYARIDRPSGIITFNKPKDPNELLNEWSYDISSLLTLVESTSHLIDRETMVHLKGKTK